MKFKNVLVANKNLNKLGGTETFTYSFIKELISKGYNVEYFAFKKGFVSSKIENDLGVSFMNKNSYDVIFSNHNKCVRHLSSKGLIIQTCHGIYPKLEQPSRFADAHVAISNEVLNHIQSKGYSGKVILNGIDCINYKPEKEINKKLKNVLSLCHSDEANEVISNACKQLNINFNSLNKYKNPIWNISKVINENDLVVGIGRSAYEAIACGRPILIYDNRSYSKSFSDGYLQKSTIDFSILNNCSGRYFKKKLDQNGIVKELKKYNSNDATFLRDFALNNLNVKTQINTYLEYANSVKKKNNYLISFFKSIFAFKLKIQLIFYNLY
ncbi:MAG: UDP-glycosyltransferase [Lutibacter sp.]|nr:MAG: UDP-glycosyltransferase [Lutibacter sp.]